MKNLFIVLLLVMGLNIFSQSDDNAMGNFALSVEPLGLVQFGPIINAEFGLTDNLVLNTHVRFGTFGLLMRVANMDEGELPEDLTNIVFGGGLKYFFSDRKNKPYIGALFEYGTRHTEFPTWSGDVKHTDFVVNGGYRFRTGSGFFITTGAYLGAELVFDDKWKYNDSSILIIEDNSIYPVFLLEVGLGFEF